MRLRDLDGRIAGATTASSSSRPVTEWGTPVRTGQHNPLETRFVMVVIGEFGDRRLAVPFEGTIRQASW